MARRFLDFTDALEALLGRRVVLMFECAKEPRFRDFIASSQEVVLAGTDRTIAA